MGKIASVVGGALLLGFLYWISARGWGVSPLHNQELIKSLNPLCPESEKDENGDCPPSAGQKGPNPYPIIIGGGGFRGAGRHSGSGSAGGGGK